MALDLRGLLKRDWAAKLVWPLAALALLLVFNLGVDLATGHMKEGFFHLEVRDGHLYGTLIDILNRGSPVVLLALGMTLVIATGGVDLSVGAVMAIAGAVAAVLITRQELLGRFFSLFGAAAAAFVMSHPALVFAVILAVSLMAAMLAGAWNGVLVAQFRVQPIVATLILMVAGRGIAQLITDGQYITFTDSRLVYIGNGHFLALPFTVTIVVAASAITWLLTRKTAIGLFVESIGSNETACRYCGINARLVKFLVYVFSGLCAGMAGLITASNIRCADANHAGLYLELDAILAVVVGGTSLAGGRFYLLGSIVGGLLIQTLTTTMYARDVSSDVAPVPKAIVIAAVCLLQSPVLRGQLAALAGRRAP